MNRNKFRARSGTRNIGACLIGAAAGAGLAAIVATAAQAADMSVPVNSSQPLTLTSPAATVMVSNPLVADVNVQNSTLVYILGKTYGQTDLVALDKDGKQILNMEINVTAPNNSMVTLTRGVGQYSYNCSPRCEAVAAQGDDKDRFKTVLQQAGALTNAGVSMGRQASGGEQ